MTQEGTDNRLLEPMAKATQAVLEQAKLNVTADAGYSNGAQFQACEDAGITPVVPPNRAINSKGGEEQFFDRSLFNYSEESDSYQCPNGKTLTLKALNKGVRVYHASIIDCGTCALKSRCSCVFTQPGNAGLLCFWGLAAVGLYLLSVP